MGEGAEDVARLGMAARRQCQALQANHGVAAPVGKPVVAGNDGAHFVAGRMGAGGVLHTACRANEELIRSQHQLPGRSVTHRG